VPVVFDIEGGNSSVSNDKMVVTQRGVILATDLKQGDFVCVLSGCPPTEIISVPVVT
jgi:hypothetical protein